MVYRTSDNNFGTAKWIVDATAGQGTHTTIATALTSSSSGDTIFIRPGSYTENLTLKAGVNLVAYSSDAGTPNVTIVGKCSFTAAGTVGISGIRLQTNSDFAIAVTGSAASIINLINCYLNVTNNTGLSLTSSSGSSAINFFSCRGDIGTTGITCFAISGSGVISFTNSTIGNTGNSTTASTSSAGGVGFNNSVFNVPITTSSTGSFTSSYSQFSTSATNTLFLTIGESSGSGSSFDTITSGSAAGVSVSGSSTFRITGSLFNSSNTNPITGAGTLTLNSASFNGTGVGINTTTVSPGTNWYGINRSSNQPAFLAYQASTAANATGDATVYTLGSTVDLTEVFDQNANFDPTTGTFTAPVTGRYYICAGIFLTAVGVQTRANALLVTSNRTYGIGNGNPTAYKTSSNAFSLTGSALADMDSADTLTCTIELSGSTKTVTVFGDATASTYLCGNLVC